MLSLVSWMGCAEGWMLIRVRSLPLVLWKTQVTRERA